MNLKHQELTQNIDSIDKKYREIVEMAKGKGIVLYNTPEDIKKFE